MNLKTQVFLVLIVTIFSFLVFSFLQPPLSYQELRRAILVKETVKDFKIFQTYNGEPYFTKPPLYTWIASVWSKPFSSNPDNLIFGLRCFSVVCYIILFLLFIKFFNKDWQSAFFSLIMLLANLRFLSFFNRVDIEPLFVLFSFLMFYFSYLYLFVAPKRIYQYLFYVFLTAGVLTRGPLNFFYLPGLLVYGLLTKDKKVFKLLLNPLGWLILLIPSLGWYSYGYVAFGKEIFKEFLDTDVKTRLLDQARDPWYYYFKHLFLNFWFCFIFLFYLIWKQKAYHKEKAKEIWYKLIQNKEVFFLSTVAIIPVFLLSFTGKKFDKYLLWVYPFWAIIFSKIFVENFSMSFLLGLKKFLLGLVLINLIFLGTIAFYNSNQISYQLHVIKKEIIQGRLAFWQKENPVIIFYASSPVKVLTTEEDLSNLLNQGYNIISEEKIPQGILKKNFVDPYKHTVWYVFSQN
jgi:4-amino-4-deoxy-L-arabinose transferase-like glycosyltransferase